MRTSPPTASRTRGFTLIELLVALGVMALMAVMGWRALAGMQQAMDSNREHANAVLALDAGLSQWTTDLDALTELPQTRTLEWNGRALRLTRRATSDESAGALVVAWTLAERDGHAQWLRWQSTPVRTREEWTSAWAAADAWQQGAGADSTNGVRMREVRIAALDQWQLYFYRGGAWSNPLSSAGSNVAGAEPATNVPDGVRLVLTVSPPHPLAGAVVRDWARAMTASAARPSSPPCCWSHWWRR